jgi:uncharacterized small protein (DUF1192 family)
MLSGKSAALSPIIAAIPRGAKTSRQSEITALPIDSKPLRADALAMIDEPDRPRPTGDAASRLAAEDLSTYSQAELEQRIALLEAEIARVKAHQARTAAHRAAAEALFRKKGA